MSTASLYFISHFLHTTITKLLLSWVDWKLYRMEREKDRTVFQFHSFPGPVILSLHTIHNYFVSFPHSHQFIFRSAPLLGFIPNNQLPQLHVSICCDSYNAPFSAWYINMYCYQDKTRCKNTVGKLKWKLIRRKWWLYKKTQQWMAF